MRLAFMCWQEEVDSMTYRMRTCLHATLPSSNQAAALPDAEPHAAPLQSLLRRFASQADLWTAAVDTLAQIDALMSLASAAQFGTDGGPLCRPVFVEPTAGQRQVSPACMLAEASVSHLHLLCTQQAAAGACVGCADPWPCHCRCLKPLGTADLTR